MGIIKLFFVLIVFIIIGSLIYLSYLGFIPIISTALGVGKTKDLGIKSTKQNYESYVKKAKTEIKYLKTSSAPADSIKLSGIQNVKDSFTEEEIAARLNYSNWKYMPATNTQIRINKNGTVEFSGNLVLNRLPGFLTYAGMVNHSMEDVNKGLKYLSMLKVNPPIYIKFDSQVNHNFPKLSVETIQVGKFKIPLEKVGANSLLTEAVRNIFLKSAGFHAMSIRFTDGKMNFDGTVPAKMEIESN